LATITPVYQQSLKLFGVQLGAATSFAISLAATANGLNRFAHFFTLGYGLSIASMAAAGLAAAKITTPAAFMHNVGLLLHGVRMSAFVAERDRSSSWKDRDAILAELDAKYGKKERLLPWAAYAAFYGLLYSPGLCHLRNPSLASSVFRPPFAYVITGLGLALQWGGLALEAVADHQKQAFKRELRAAGKPDTWCNTGLYSRIRHPNYLGEQLFWIGSALAGLPAMNSGVQLIAGGLGTAGILSTMRAAEAKLESKQRAKYGGIKRGLGYKEYIDSTGSLLPKF